MSSKLHTGAGQYNRMTLLLLLALCFHIGEFDIDVVIDDAQRSWMDASTSGQCQLAGGTLTNGTIAGSLTLNVIGSDLPTSEAWVGATITYLSWIEFKGCRFGREIDASFRYDITTRVDPVQTCMETCGDFIFYLTSTWCYCTEGVIYSERLCTVVTCPGDRPCGNLSVPFASFTYHCMCEYEPILVPTEDNLVGECKTVSHDGEGGVDIPTTNCSGLYSVMCVDPDENRNIPGTIADIWINSVHICDHQGGQMIGLDGASLALGTEKQYWIGVFRSRYIHWKTTDISTPTYCLSAAISADGSLQTFVRLCTTLLTSLCETEVSTTAGQSTEPVSQDQTTPESEAASTTVSMDTTSVETERTGLLVGLVLTCVFGIVAFVLIHYFIVKQRQQRRQKEELGRSESLKRLSQASMENILSVIEPGNEAQMYDELNERSNKPDMYDHMKGDEMTSPDLYSYDKLDKGGHQAIQTGSGTYNTMDTIYALQDGCYSTMTDLQRAADPTPPTLTDINMYDTLGGKHSALD